MGVQRVRNRSSKKYPNVFTFRGWRMRVLESGGTCVVYCRAKEYLPLCFFKVCVIYVLTIYSFINFSH